MQIETFSHPYHCNEPSSPPPGRLGSGSSQLLPTLLWIFFLCGAFFQQFPEMRPVLSSVAPVVLVITSCAVVLSFLRKASSLPIALAWVLAVFILSFSSEVFGVHTGTLFGSYFYGDVLGPKFWGVPFVIGFAWVKVLIISYALVSPRVSHPLLAALTCSVFATSYDVVMEPAALHLGYWTWLSVTIPLWNYVCWFVLSLLFVLPVTLFRLSSPPFPSYITHLFFAEEAYFIFITLSSSL
jgi:bisanhydrobacterioruberin hydratase